MVLLLPGYPSYRKKKVERLALAGNNFFFLYFMISLFHNEPR
jgi:hypothetical protein